MMMAVHVDQLSFMFSATDFSRPHVLAFLACAASPSSSVSPLLPPHVAAGQEGKWRHDMYTCARTMHDGKHASPKCTAKCQVLYILVYMEQVHSPRLVRLPIVDRKRHRLLGFVVLLQRRVSEDLQRPNEQRISPRRRKPPILKRPVPLR